MCMHEHRMWNDRHWRFGRVGGLEGVGDEKLLDGYNVIIQVIDALKAQASLLCDLFM